MDLGNMTDCILIQDFLVFMLTLNKVASFHNEAHFFLYLKS